MNTYLALYARERMYRGDVTQVQHRCQQAVRQIVQGSMGGAYDAYWAGSAKATANAFVGSRWQVPAKGQPEPGDLLYKRAGSGGDGHVGIYIGDNLVAENSSTRVGRVAGRGALGFRSLSQFDAGVPHDVRVRLADLYGWTVRVGSGAVIAGTEIPERPGGAGDGHVWVRVKQWADALGMKAGMTGARVHVGGELVEGEVWMVTPSMAVMQVVDLARAAGLQVRASGRAVEVHR